MGKYFREIVHHVERMGTQEYIIAVVVAIAIGFICLKGFGSRAGY